MQLWTFLHITSMFAAVTIVIGSEWWATYAIRRGDIGALRAYFRVSRRADALGTVLFVAGIAFGLIAAVTIGWDLLRGWLVVAYVLVALTIVVGSLTMPYLGRVEAALPEGDDHEPGPELASLLRSPVPLVASAISGLLIALIIADMVFKPTF